MGSCPQIPWYVNDVDPPVAAEKQHRGQHLASLIVQKIVVPVPLYHGWNRNAIMR